jgi:RNA polymerase sigma-54 factor
MRLEIKIKQSMTATLAMQQAFLVLQMPTYELAAWLQMQIDQNPILKVPEAQGEAADQPPVQEIDFEKKSFNILNEMDETFTGALFPEEGPKEKQKEGALSYTCSLFEHLMRQAQEVFSSPKDLAEAESVIGNLDARGFLGDAPADPKILETIQTFDPPGIGARNLQESLLIQLQLKGKADSIAYQVVRYYFNELLHNQFPEIEKKTKIPMCALQKTLHQEIGSLDFHPGHRFLSSVAPTLIPDIYVQKREEAWQIVVNDSFLPKFEIAPPPPELFQNEEKAFIRTHVAQGKWLLRTLRRRQETLTKIVSFLLQKQADFFNGQPHKLQPLTLHEAAQELGLHESTVARAVSDKYLSSPQGIFSLKSFFTQALHTSEGKKVSARTARDLIKKLVDSEDKQSPLSDDSIASSLEKQGIPCARRTVAKYRKNLQIPTASQRRRWG